MIVVNIYCRDFYYYENIYGNHTSKWLCLGYTMLVSIITSPILCIIIKYEKNLHYRTLINQMVSSVMWNALLYNIVMPPLTLLFNIITPINSPVVCRIYFLVHSIITDHVVFLADAMIVIKYIFIFHLKNPTAVQDDFWKFWINLWTYIFCLLTGIVYNTIPGRDKPRISICIGKIPMKHIKAPYKIAGHSIFMFLLTLLINVGFFTVHIIHRIFGLKKMQKYQKYQSQFANVNKTNLFSFVPTFLVFVLLFCGHFLADKVSSLHPSVLDSYPYYIMEYALEALMSSSAILIFVLSHLYKHDHLRREVWNEIQQLVHCLNND